MDAFLAAHAQLRDEYGRRMIVRNGHLPERHIQTGLGQVSVKMPRARDKSGSEICEVSDMIALALKALRGGDRGLLG